MEGRDGVALPAMRREAAERGGRCAILPCRIPTLGIRMCAFQEQLAIRKQGRCSLRSRTTCWCGLSLALEAPFGVWLHGNGVQTVAHSRAHIVVCPGRVAHTGVDPKTVLCQFFKQGVCTKGTHQLRRSMPYSRGCTGGTPGALPAATDVTRPPGATRRTQACARRAQHGMPGNKGRQRPPIKRSNRRTYRRLAAVHALPLRSHPPRCVAYAPAAAGHSATLAAAGDTRGRRGCGLCEAAGGNDVL
jgi:hypothetical protein